MANRDDAAKVFIGGRWRTILQKSVSCAAGATTDIVDPAGAFSVYVVGYKFSCDTDATTFSFIDSTPTTLTVAATYMKGGGEVVFPYKTKLLVTANSKKLQGVTVTGIVVVTVWYVVF